MSFDGDTWLPKIDTVRCIGCKSCVTQCPADALESVGGKAILAHPQQCVYCAACEDVCPTAAIELPFLIVWNVPKGGNFNEQKAD